MTTVARTLLDLGAVVPTRVLRKAVAEADFRRLLDPGAVDSVLGPGRPGSAALRAALEHHLPQYARTLSPSEDAFLDLCESGGIPLPEVNVFVEGFKVDALWREKRVIVELDSRGAHGTPAAVERDHARDLALRLAGHVVVRYTWWQVTDKPEHVKADLRATLDASHLEASGLRRPS